MLATFLILALTQVKSPAAPVRDPFLRAELLTRMKAEQDARVELGTVNPENKPLTAADYLKVVNNGRADEPDFESIFNGKDLTGWRIGKADLAGKQLRETIFDPLLPYLHGCRRLFLAPDGNLTYLPFEVLPTAHGHLPSRGRRSRRSIRLDRFRRKSQRR